MPPVTATALIELLRQSHLLEPEEMQELPRLGQVFPEPARLLQHLLQRQWITRFQAHLLLHGKGRKLVFGSYILMDLLGSGGMGRVFRARNWKLGRHVALKIIRPDLLKREEAVRRFYREIRAFASLDHPNIVKAYDAADHRGIHYFAMEFVEGQDLAHLVETHGPVAFSDACARIRQAALGLEHAIGRHLIHRDIKPSNLLLADRTNDIKLTDLGLARMFSAPEHQSATLTGMGRLVGTPDFIAPEQIRNAHHVDHRADIYALGCTLFYLLAGRVPFPGGNPTEKMLRQMTEACPPLPTFRSDLPLPAVQFIERMMAKDPVQRPATHAEVAEELSRFLVAAPTTVGLNSSEPTLTIVKLPTEQQPSLAETINVDVDQVWIPAESEHLDDSPTEEIQRPTRTPADNRWWLLSGLSCCILALTLIVVQRDKSRTIVFVTPTAIREVQPEASNEEWNLIRGTLARHEWNEQDLRRELLVFTERFPLSEHGIDASQMLRELPSPLDHVATRVVGSARPASLPEDLRAGWRFHSSSGWARLRDWSTTRTQSAEPSMDRPQVSHLRFANDGHTLWVGSTNQQAQTVDLVSNEQYLVPGHSPNEPILAVSGDGQRVFGRADDALRVWDTVSGATWCSLPLQRPIPRLALFTPDGTHLLMVMDSPATTVELIECESGRVLRELELGNDSIQAIAISRNGKSVAVAGEKSLRLLELSSGMVVRSWGVSTDNRIADLVFSPDGLTLYSTSERGNLCAWDTTGNADVRVRNGHSVGGRSILISPDGTNLLTCSIEGEMILWQVQTLEKLRTWRFIAPMLVACFTPDSRHLVAADGAGNLLLFRVPVR